MDRPGFSPSSKVILGGRFDRSSDQLIRFASVGALTFSVVFALLVVAAIAVWPPASVHTAEAAAATAVYLPLHLHHLRYALRGRRPPAGRSTLTVMAIVLVGAAPIIGSLWLFAFYALAASALIVVRSRWSVPLFAVVVIAAAVFAAGMGQPAGTVAWTTVGVIFRAVTPFVLVWLVCALRDLESARTALANEAVAGERARLEEQLRESIGAELQTVMARAARAGELLSRDREAAKEELRQLVEGARDTLAAARRIIAFYRRVPAVVELESAAALLRAAGMGVDLVVPDAASQQPLDDGARLSLRTATAELLRVGSARRVEIQLADDGAELRVRSVDANVAAAPGREPAR